MEANDKYLERLIRIEERLSVCQQDIIEIKKEIAYIKVTAEILKENLWKVKLRFVALAALSGGTVAGALKLIGI